MRFKRSTPVITAFVLTSAFLLPNLTFADKVGAECLKYYESNLDESYTPNKHTEEAQSYLENMHNIVGGQPMGMIFGLVNAVGLEIGYFQELDKQRISQGQTVDLMRALHRSNQENSNSALFSSEPFNWLKALVQEKFDMQIEDSKLAERLLLDYLNSSLFCGTKAEGIEDEKTVLKKRKHLEKEVEKAHRELMDLVSKNPDPKNKSKDVELSEISEIEIDSDQENKIEGAVFTLDKIIDRFVLLHKSTDF